MTRKIASRSAAVALLVLGALTGVVQAEPVELTEAQMDQVSAGAFQIEWRGNRLTLRSSWGITYTYVPERNLWYRGGDASWWMAAEGPPDHLVDGGDGFAYGWLGRLNPDGSCCFLDMWTRGDQRGRYGVVLPGQYDGPSAP